MDMGIAKGHDMQILMICIIQTVRNVLPLFFNLFRCRFISIV